MYKPNTRYWRKFLLNNNIRPLFRLPFTLYFVSLEKTFDKIYLCLSRKEFNADGDGTDGDGTHGMYYYKKL